MSRSYADLLRVADRNSRTAAQKLEEEERRKREKLKPKIDQSRAVNQEAIEKILERRKREAHQQKQLELKRKKLADEQRLKKAAEAKRQQSSKPVNTSSKSIPQVKSKSTQPPPPAKPKKPAIPYDDLMRYASLNANNQPIPKELAYVAQSLRENKPPTSKTLPSSKPSTSAPPMKKTVIPSTSNKLVRPSSRPTQSNGHKPVIPPKVTRPSVPPPTRTITNGHQRSSLPVNGHRLPPKRPRIDTDDEDEDDEEMRDFIVDDDENNNGFDYRKELRDTLKKNFRFDSDRYRARILRDDDDDDLRNMESSFDQIEKEEDYSRRIGEEEDIEDMVREQAELKKKKASTAKRPKTTPK